MSSDDDVKLYIHYKSIDIHFDSSVFENTQSSLPRIKK